MNKCVANRIWKHIIVHDKKWIHSVSISTCFSLCMTLVWCACVMFALRAAPSLWTLLCRSRCGRISSVVVRYVSMSPSVTESECQLDVPVTKLSLLSGSQIHHVEMGTDPRQQKPTTPQIHTNMQMNYKINITRQTSHPSMTSFWTAQHQSGSTNQPRRQRGWLNAFSNPHSLLLIQ